MDLTSSPDLDARLCYLVVLLVGAVVTANALATQLNGRLPWHDVETWLLFMAYLAVPAALYWFLDRTRVISDTSLFSAVIVGSGYQLILAGKGSLAVPGAVSNLWRPFDAWADRIKQNALRKAAAAAAQAGGAAPQPSPWKMLGAAFAAALLIMGMVLIMVTCLVLTLWSGGFRANYLAWRLAKPNATAPDILRTRRAIRAALNDGRNGDAMLQALLSAVESPELPDVRNDDVFALLLEYRHDLRGLRDGLIELLRTGNPDVRSRAQQALLFLHKGDGGAALPAELQDWKPSAADTAEVIEDHITLWKEV